MVYAQLLGKKTVGVWMESILVRSWFYIVYKAAKLVLYTNPLSVLVAPCNNGGQLLSTVCIATSNGPMGVLVVGPWLILVHQYPPELKMEG